MFQISIYSLLSVIILFSGLIIISAIDPIHRIVWLILAFISSAFLFILLDFYFLGLTYIIVYVGAIAILFLFVIMMIPINIISQIGAQDGNSRVFPTNFKFSSNLLLVLLFSMFFLLMFSYSATLDSVIVNYFQSSWSLEYKTMTDIESLAIMIYVTYPLGLLFIGVTLWVVMIGVIRILRG